MIKGIGIDIIEVCRIENSIRNPKFVNKIFTAKEQEYLLKRNMNKLTAAGMFSAKEAVSKALGTGFGKVKWTDIEILKEAGGKPYAVLHGAAAQTLKSMGGTRVFVSIAHIKEYALAQAVIE